MGVDVDDFLVLFNHDLINLKTPANCKQCADAWYENILHPEPYTVEVTVDMNMLDSFYVIYPSQVLELQEMQRLRHPRGKRFHYLRRWLRRDKPNFDMTKIDTSINFFTEATS